jgi:uncharacterized protein YjeT (DUF2065 family)
MKKMTPLATALVGVLTGVVCLGFVVLAKHVGLELSDLTQEALTMGGLTALLGGVAGARFMPTKGEEPKP